MTIADKIRSILAIKDQIKAAILAKGVAINNQTPYADYPAKIQAIASADPTLETAAYTVTATDVKLTKVVLPSAAKTIQAYALYNNSNIKEITVQEGTTKLDGYALYQTPNAEKITLPTTLTFIGSYALSLNNQLLEATIPANINLNNAQFLFANNTKMKKIDISACLLTTATPTSFAESVRDLTQVLLPPSATTIGANSFSSCPNLKTFDFANILTIISGAFSSSGLTSINAPKATSIGNGAFTNTPITHAILPKVTNIGINALSNCPSCKYIEIGSSISIIGQGAISGSKLEAIVIKATAPPTIENDSFPSSGNYKIYVPDASVAAYKAVYNWMFFLNRITPMSEFVMPVL